MFTPKVCVCICVCVCMCVCTCVCVLVHYTPCSSVFKVHLLQASLSAVRSVLLLRETTKAHITQSPSSLHSDTHPNNHDYNNFHRHFVVSYLPTGLSTDQVLAAHVWEEPEQHVCAEGPVVGQIRPVLTHRPLEAEVIAGRPAATPGTDPRTEDQLQTGEAVSPRQCRASTQQHKTCHQSKGI